MTKKSIIFLVAIILFTVAPSTASDVYTFGKDSTVIGLPKTYVVKERESLIEIARKFGLGYNSIENANPQLDPFTPGTGQTVKIPSTWVLPDVPSYEGIVINLSEMRLYYFLGPKSHLVRTFPIGIGREGFDTPLGTFKIIQKIPNPSWHVPKSIREEKPELPAVVPPGPENPLGSHALRLSLGDVLIHGTNKPWGVGRRVSHGCIRLYPEHIPQLFALANNGVRVIIVKQPVKVGVRNNTVYVEVHKEEDSSVNYLNEAIQLLRKKNLIHKVNTERLYTAVRKKQGVPVDISSPSQKILELAAQ